MKPAMYLDAPGVKSLLHAVVDSSPLPLLLLDGDLGVAAASATFCAKFGIDPMSIHGKNFASLGSGEWGSAQLNALLVATASGFACAATYEIGIEQPGQGRRSLVLSAQKLDYDEPGSVRMMVSVNDVTDARASDRLRDALVAENGILLQELQHRVANSLQIVASVLMQSARRVQSDEARVHLADACTRVLSIAALQRQLTAPRLGDVALGPYLKALCETIGASMIHRPDRLSLEVRIDASITTAERSISLGLIVTELVINALKHAFPDEDRPGKIFVDYHSHGAAWAVSVADDGIGLSAERSMTTGGLGTSIVSALSHQLGALVRTDRVDPGTIVWIIGNRSGETGWPGAVANDVLNLRDADSQH